MKVEVQAGELHIVPEDEQDRAWLQYVLGLEREGDEAVVKRRDERVGFDGDARQMSRAVVTRKGGSDG
ncbi:MAG: hypothetical protein AAF593_01230 [Planctomycetota bacterium]